MPIEASEANKRRYQEKLDLYLQNPNVCMFCGKSILPGRAKLSELKTMKFCNHSCAISYLNREKSKGEKPKRLCACGKVISRKAPRCRDCYNLEKSKRVAKSQSFIQKGEHKEKNPLYQNYRSLISDHARRVYNNSGKKKECFVCGYERYVEICHVKAVKDFSPESTFEEINNIDNLVALCPTHHWEFDHGFLEIK